MKQTITILALLFFTWYGCKKSDEPMVQTPPPSTPPPSSSTWSFTSTINGTVINADSARGYFHMDSIGSTPIRIFLIMGYCDNEIVVPGFSELSNSTAITVMNYNNSADGADLQYNDLTDSINDYLETSAQFKITFVDTVAKKMSGTFNGIVVGDVTNDTVIVTNGNFSNIDYVIW